MINVKDTKKVVTIRMNEQILERLDSYAKENGFTRSTALQFIAKKYLETERKEEKVIDAR